MRLEACKTHDNMRIQLLKFDRIIKINSKLVFVGQTLPLEKLEFLYAPKNEVSSQVTFGLMKKKPHEVV